MAARITSVLAGVWLMAAPAVLGYGDPAGANDLVVGPLVASLGVVSIWQVARGLRWLVALAGVWLLISPWILGHPNDALVNSLVVGLVLIITGSIRGKLSEAVGGGWKAIWKEEST